MLNLLIDYAREKGLTIEPGFKPKMVRWAIMLDHEGRLLNVQELGNTGHNKNKGMTFNICPDLSLPEMKAVGDGCRHFLVDNVEVVTLMSEGEPDAKLIAKHKFFIDLLTKASSVFPEIGLGVNVLCNKEIRARLIRQLGELKAKPTDNVTFAILGRDPVYLVEDPIWHDWWRCYRQEIAQKRNKSVSPRQRKNQNDGPILRRCLASGQLVQAQKTHYMIEGLSDVGGLPMGDALASFKQDSFRSYGLEQGDNCAVGEQEAAAYRAALTHLIKHHGQKLGSTKMIHWYAGRNEIPHQVDPFYLLPAGLGLADGDESGEKISEADAQRRAEELLSSLRTGKFHSDLADYRYYALTLSGASGRVMIRDWIEGRFEELVTNIGYWFSDLEIVDRHGRCTARSPKFMAVLGGLVRDLKDLSAPMTAKMWRVAIKREAIPHQVIAQTLARVKIDILQDNPANHARMGLIKAYHLRKGDQEMKPYLNSDHPNPAYQCGRLLAVLADLQYAALGDVGAGVVQRYYAAASATPGLVLGRLVRNSQFHLNKLNKKLAYSYEIRLAEIWGRIEDNPPSTLCLEDQTLFAMGYYQQKANRMLHEKETTPVETVETTKE